MAKKKIIIRFVEFGEKNKKIFNKTPINIFYLWYNIMYSCIKIMVILNIVKNGVVL